MTSARKLKIVIEGDSWHDLPRLGFKYPGIGGSDYDIARALHDFGHEVASYARWAHTLEKIAGDKEYLTGLTVHKPDVLMLCGGGNDMFDGRKLETFLRVYEKNRLPLAYIKKTEFSKVLKPILNNYRLIFKEIRAHPFGSVVPVICHSYDYILPRPPFPWFYEPMKKFGIFDDTGKPMKKGLPEAIAAEIVKWFHRELKKVTEEFNEVYLVKLHGSVGKSKKDWHDEIHPSRPGFERVARKMEKQALLVTEPQSQVHTV